LSVISIAGVQQPAARVRRAFRTRLAAGEKPARKGMATLATVYDAIPAIRSPTVEIHPHHFTFGLVIRP
jgi:hypothetical protein